jgi:hypothetical protein
METLCSLLIGPQGNLGYNFVGRPDKHSQEEMLLNGEHQSKMETARLNIFLLYDYLAQRMNEFLAESIEDKQGISRTRCHIRSKSYYLLIDFYMFMIIYTI